jgi:hypothetical protein
MRFSSTVIILATAASSALSAQTARGNGAVETITEADVRRRIAIIADDSMRGRNTPSPGLEKTAAYIASEFKRFGLTPGGDSGTFIQRYSIARRRVDSTGSEVTLQSGSVVAKAPLAWAAAGLSSAVPMAPISGAAQLIAGPITAAVAARLDIDDKVVLWVVDLAKPSPESQKAIEALYARGPAAVLLISNRDSTTIARMAARQFRERVTIGNNSGVPILELQESVVRPALAAAGLDAAELRSASSIVHRTVPALTITVTVNQKTLSENFAPNNVGILEGSDPVLKNEYIVFSAHMDHVGVGAPAAGSTDSIFNGADDDASGTVGVIELAEAFSRPGARPKRSLIFLTVSGEEHGLWGSDFFAENAPVPVNQIVANLNMDMIGRNWRDTIAVIGKEHSDLGATLNRVNSAHPELGMKAIDDIWPQEQFYYRSDHFNFARRGVPVLFFFNGTHPDYHKQSDEVSKIDAEKEMRIVRLVYYLGLEVGNAAEKPKWKPESYKEIVGK